VPNIMMLGPIQFNDMYCGPRGSWWAVISAFSPTCRQIGASCPPYSRGQAIVSQPRSAISLVIRA
jgi:hypothetical protein